jgi:2-polyprenyl-3-methyl-5-hydroxy-6-metoxy-1,4-benzoquinol methylase
VDEDRDERSLDFPEFDAASTETWDRLADWWDDRIGDGNPTQDLLVEPVTERLLELKPGEQVLDVACGAGRFARRMADAGVTVLAIDAAERFLARARQRSAGYEDRIEYRRVDAADPTALLSLGEQGFDAAVCTMALMDMASITPLIATLPRLLRPESARFVFSVTHPVFNSGDARPLVELVEDGTTVRERHRVSVADYLAPRETPGIGVSGQPERAHYFHRPMSTLLNAFFEHGFVLDRLEEPAFPESEIGSGPLSQRNFHEIPWVMVARMRLAGEAPDRVGRPPSESLEEDAQEEQGDGGDRRVDAEGDRGEAGDRPGQNRQEERHGGKGGQ